MLTTVETVIAIIGSIILVQIQLIGMVKWLVKHYLNELIPNSGSSMKDQINRLEARQWEIYQAMMDK